MTVRDIAGIARETLDTALASAEDSHPRRFVAHLRATPAADVGIDTDEGGRILTEVVFTPRSGPGDVFGVLGVDTLPRRSSIVGTVASAPSGELEGEDYSRFTNRGRVHIVAFPPYDDGSWRVYDSEGAERELAVVDVDFGDEDGGWLTLDIDLDRFTRG